MRTPLSNPVVRNWLYIAAGCAGALAALTKLAVAVGWLTPAAADALYDLWTWLAGLSSVGNLVASTVLSRQRREQAIQAAFDEGMTYRDHDRDDDRDDDYGAHAAAAPAVTHEGG